MPRLAHLDPAPVAEAEPTAPVVRMLWNRVTGRDGRVRLVCRWVPAAAYAVR
jgi:hypothetical protein